MANRYAAIVETLSDGRIMSEMLRTQIALFATWCDINDVDQDTADLAAYGRWLEGWGYPVRAAAMHVDAIRRLRDGT